MVPLIYLCVQYMIPCGGLPHSEIHGSKIICISPWLIAAYHVFLRFSVPRHSPCALSSLTIFSLNHKDFSFSEFYIPNRIFNKIVDFTDFSQVFHFTSLCLLYLSFLSIVLFSFQGTIFSVRLPGGLKWTRTIDLSVISRVL